MAITLTVNVICRAGFKNFSIMLLDYRFYVIHAAIAYFTAISVKDWP